MLTAFHLFHHYRWCGSVASFKFPPAKLPAVCLACLLASTKAEDCNAKLEVMLQQMRQLEPILPPLEGIFPLGQRPQPKEVCMYVRARDCIARAPSCVRVCVCVVSRVPLLCVLFFFLSR